MAEPESTINVDHLLRAYLDACSESESDRWLTEIVEDQTNATIRGIVRSKLYASLSPGDTTLVNQDALDLVGEIQAALIGRLRELKRNNGAAIDNLPGYIATIAFNACNQHLRAKYPERWRLKSKLRYLLSHHAGFALDKGDAGEWVCGLAAVRITTEAAARPSELEALLDDEEVRNAASVFLAGGERARFASLVLSVLGRIQSPVVLDEMVGLIARLLGVDEKSAAANLADNKSAERSRAGATSGMGAQTGLEELARLGQLWAEITALPLRHRLALLLNLRDSRGREIISAFPLSRVATIRQIAAALGFEHGMFAEVWSDLPWGDRRIAEHMGLSRQQVINLRHSVRERLARRMKLSGWAD